MLRDNGLDIDLSRYTCSFTSSPTFTVSNIVGGTVTLSGAGNSQARFVPPADTAGRAMFDFTVTDSQGISWTQRFAILVSADPLPVDPVSVPLVWKGNGTSHTWDSTSGNRMWLDGETSTGWSDTDTATFDDSGFNSPDITISGTVLSSGVTVDSSKNHTFTGSGAIGGASSLTKSEGDPRQQEPGGPSLAWPRSSTRRLLPRRTTTDTACGIAAPCRRS